MKIGYVRVSTKDQNLDLQIEALEKQDVRNLSRENFGSDKKSSELDKMIEQFREGDELYVWRLNRRGTILNNKEIIIKDLTDGVLSMGNFS